MKNIFFGENKIIAGLLMAAGLFTSCKKLIEIPPNPPSAITQALQFSDSATAVGAIAGVYSYGGFSEGFAYSDGMFTEATGLSSDELSYTNTYDPATEQFYNYALTPLNYPVSALWSSVYTGIYPINAIIQGIANNSKLSASFIKQVTGEMKVVRALYYFNLVNLFGAVPLVTSTDYKVTANLPRTPVDSVYNQILSDLSDAQQDLVPGYSSPGRARPNLYTALALLSKVHLYRGNWQDAYNEADSVITSGLYNLEPDLDNVFLDGSAEAIWQLPAAGSYKVTSEAYNFIPLYVTIPPYLLTPFLLNAFEPGDQRMQDWVGTTVVNVGGNNENLYYPYKYKNIDPTSTPVEDYMIFRLAEFYLIRAEAGAHLGKLDEAIADVNTVRARAGLPGSTADPSSQDNVLNAVMHERQIELFTEWGNRWFDLKRTGMADSVLGTEKTGWQNDAALYPIPQTQLQLDYQLKQNPGYQ